ncbi:MAG: hypothetical protein Q8Q81_04485 [Oxalobacteraceae bacterium]|nr:hypothetical protein [Oxalobacteraceae bacterium]
MQETPINIITPEQAICALSEALSVLRASGVIRSTRFVGDIGEWYVATLYDGELPLSQVQKGWDVLERSTGARLQVKTQTFDPKNQWNYLTTRPEFFDRLLVVLLTGTLTVRDLYDIPSEDIQKLVRVGKENKPIYRFKDLEPWRVQTSSLPGYGKFGRVVQINS